jgi:DNA polymerase-3 subunit alpha
VRAGASYSIIEERESGGPFRSVYDFAERVDLTNVNRRIIENLIKCGAMSSLPGNRGQLTAVIENAMETGQRAWKDRQSGQAGLFGMVAEEPAHIEQPLPALPDWTPQQKLSTLEGLERGAEVAICGILTGIQRRRNKEGKLWAAMHLEDRTGSVEAMVFTTQYDRLLTNLVEDQAVLVRGLVLPEENAPPKISVQDIVPLELARLNRPRLISIRVAVGANGSLDKAMDKAIDKAEALQQLFARKRGDTEVRLRLEKARDFSVILDVTPKVRPDKEFRAEVERICGPESVEILAS